jgi:uncharacterized protein YdaU (DUF1376 family)
MLPLFVRDYVTATRHMSLAERGAYTDLLFFQWENGQLPKEPERLARLISCTIDELAAVWSVIGGKFVEGGSGLLNERLEQHRTKAIALSEKRASSGRSGGKQSAKQRAKQRGSKTEPVARNLLEAKSNSPSPSPSPSPESKRPRKRGSRLPEDFRPDLEHAQSVIRDIDAQAETEKFCDYWKARSGSGATKQDWPATWRSWIANCRDSGRYARAAQGIGSKGMPCLNG